MADIHEDFYLMQTNPDPYFALSIHRKQNRDQVRGLYYKPVGLLGHG